MHARRLKLADSVQDVSVLAVEGFESAVGELFDYGEEAGVEVEQEFLDVL